MSREKKNILLLFGGGGPEHSISETSAQFFEDHLSNIPGISVHPLCLKSGESLLTALGDMPVHYAIPCLHGYPGETGHIQGILDILGIPYLGASGEVSSLCFNKVSTKLWLSTLGIPHTPYLFFSRRDDRASLNSFLEKHGQIFIKPGSQGSSIGCHLVRDMDEAHRALDEALSFSPLGLVEKAIVGGRELEMAVFDYKGKTVVTAPGEIICPGEFYSYSEKYDPASTTKILTVAPDLSPDIQESLQDYARRAYGGLGIKDLARIDFFLYPEGKIYLNEINTMPGHTPISLFPLVMENHGVPYGDFLREKISEENQ